MKESSIFDSIEGLEPVDPAILEDYKREMTERVIPEIERVIEERAILAAQARWRIL